jgi:hypothetical protein
MKLPENLTLDTWFKAFAYLGGTIFVLAIFVPVRAGSNELIAVVGVGMFLLGVGRWKNQKTFTALQNQGFGSLLKMSTERRSPDIVGLFFELSGWVLLLVAIGSVVVTVVTGTSLVFYIS